MMRKMIILAMWLTGGHLLLGLTLLVVLSNSGIDEGIGYYLHLLFGIPNLPAMFLLGFLGLYTESVSLNIVLLMLAGIPQWVLMAVLLVVADNLFLWIRVRAENSLVEKQEGHAEMLEQLKEYNKIDP